MLMLVMPWTLVGWLPCDWVVGWLLGLPAAAWLVWLLCLGASAVGSLAFVCETYVIVRQQPSDRQWRVRGTCDDV